MNNIDALLIEKIYFKDKNGKNKINFRKVKNLNNDELEYLNENIVINRITGDPKEEDLIEPNWLVKKFCVLNDIDKEMVKRETYQGKALEKTSKEL